MKASATKTARFAVVVKEAGRPETVFLWSKPEHNPDLMKAVRQNRVMTIKQETKGTGKDFGIVGFIQEKNVSYLVFPKPLNPFKDARIIGINYDLIKDPAPVGRLVEPTADRPKSFGSRRIRANATKPTERSRNTAASMVASTRQKQRKRFKVTIRFTALADVVQETVAPTATAARERALKNSQAPDFSRATITRKVIRAQRG
jgi:hypothetical protein